jgi:steroid delta-isomerase-like uncharacterized protein
MPSLGEEGRRTLRRTVPKTASILAVTAETNKQLLHRYIDQLNQRNFAVLDELVAADVTLGSLLRSESDDIESGRELYRQGILDRLRAFPDYQVTVLEMIAEEDQVMVYWRYRGTFQAEFRGVPPTGKVVEEAAISIYRLREGQIVGVRGYWDRADTWQQFGLLPPDRPPLPT